VDVAILLINSTAQKMEQAMALTTEQTKDILQKYATGTNDTGSPQVQVALITARIAQLGGHFAVHVKDHHSRQGLLKLVGERRRMLKYLERKDVAAYKKLIGELGLRK
jgi:small subunit ribosomal protein S15